MYIEQRLRHDTAFLNPTLTGNQSLTSFPTRTHTLLSHKNSVLPSTIFLQLNTLLPSVTYHVDRSYHMPFPNPQTPRIHLSHFRDTFHTPALRQTLGPGIFYPD